MLLLLLSCSSLFSFSLSHLSFCFGGLFFKSFRLPEESRGICADKCRPVRLRSLRHTARVRFLRQSKRLRKSLRACGRPVVETRPVSSGVHSCSSLVLLRRLNTLRAREWS